MLLFGDLNCSYGELKCNHNFLIINQLVCFDDFKHQFLWRI